jgi:hypothetical protein
VVERAAQDERLWSFPAGLIGADDSVKGFEVEARDGPAGHVSWASYAPGESYLVVTVPHHLHRTHRVVPASAVERRPRRTQGLAPRPQAGRRGGTGAAGANGTG